MIPDTKRLRPVVSFLAGAGAAIAALGCAYLFLTPKIWQAAAQVRVEQGGRVRLDKPGAAAPNLSEAPLMGAERQFIGSDELLSEAAQNLHLSESWGRQYKQGTALSTNEVLANLRGRLRIAPVEASSVIEVRVTGDNRSEDAQIANEIVHVYKAHRTRQSESASSARFKDLQRRWQEQDQKLAQAERELGTVTSGINKARLANTNAIYDPESIAMMRADRDRRQSELTQEQQDLAELKALSPDLLRRVLPTAVTNAMLNGALERLAAAQRDLEQARSTYGADARETKDAEMVEQRLDKEADRLAAQILHEREDDLDLEKTIIAKLTEQLANARTNVAEFSTNNPAYVAALGKVQALKQERDSMSNELMIATSEAVSPITLAAEIVEEAEPPSQPVSPDRRLGAGIITTGCLFVAAGLALFLFGVWARHAGAKTGKARSTA